MLLVPERGIALRYWVARQWRRLINPSLVNIFNRLSQSIIKLKSKDITPKFAATGFFTAIVPARLTLSFEASPWYFNVARHLLDIFHGVLARHGRQKTISRGQQVWSKSHFRSGKINRLSTQNSNPKTPTFCRQFFLSPLVLGYQMSNRRKIRLACIWMV